MKKAYKYFYAVVFWALCAMTHYAWGQSGISIVSISVDTGENQTDSITADALICLHGEISGATLQLPATVTLYRAEGNSRHFDTFESVQINSESWRIEHKTQLNDGQYRFKIKASDTNGTTTVFSDEYAVTIDRTPPTLTAEITSPSGSATPSFRGVIAETKLAVSLTVNGRAYNVTQNTLGLWACRISEALSPGLYEAIASVRDTAGNTTSQTISFTICGSGVSETRHE